MTGHRVVQGLQWAEARERGPWGPSRGRGAKALGRRYENALAKALGPGWVHGQWFEFFDKNGKGWCQPDFLQIWGDRIWILEAKYTWVSEGQSQISQLYQPVVEKALGKRVAGLVVCKILVPEVLGEVTGDLNLAFAHAITGKRTVLHWLGQGPLTGHASVPPRPAALTRAPTTRTMREKTLEELGL